MKPLQTRASSHRLHALLTCWLALGCSGPDGRPPERPADPRRGLQGLQDTSWTWTQGECVGRPLDLASRGFRQRLHIEAARDGLLLYTESRFEAESCSRTVVRMARPGPEPGLWRFEEQARVALPPSERCQGTAESSREGTVRLSGERLELLAYRSTWCGGFDARFAYSRAEPEPLSELEVIRRYAAHFNRRDADAVAALFAQQGSLIEPFAPTTDGNLQRHDGRTAVRRWYAGAFASVPWLALRLLSVAGAGSPEATVAEWQYMDPELAAPFSGRNTFVIAGGEIFETEVQVTTEIVPARAAEPL